MIERRLGPSYDRPGRQRTPADDLASDLGFRPPTSNELTRILLRHARSGFRRRRPFSRATILQSSLISADPFIAYSGITQAPLGLASEFDAGIDRMRTIAKIRDSDAMDTPLLIVFCGSERASKSPMSIARCFGGLVSLAA